MMPNTESYVTLFDQLIKYDGGSINLGVKESHGAGGFLVVNDKSSLPEAY
jgi:hypothetical protein